MLFAFPVLVLYTAREYVSINDIVSTQKEYSDSIYNFAYNGLSHLAYKQALIDEHKPTVVVLGTSRVMEIRKEFFTQQELFVNAGCPCSAKTLGDVAFFIDNLQASTSIQVILLGLDREMFYKKENRSVDVETPQILALKDALFVTFKNIYLDALTHKYAFSTLYKESQATNHIGLQALVHGNGFRFDGSYVYGKEQADPHRNSHVADLIRFEQEAIVKTNHQETQEERELVSYNLRKLDGLIQQAQQKGITVIGFTLPYPEPVYQDMSKVEGVYKDMITTLPSAIGEVFRAYGMEFFDIPSPRALGAKDTEFIDSLHGTDLMALRMVVYMGERSKTLRAYISMQTLKTMIKNTQGDFLPQ